MAKEPYRYNTLSAERAAKLKRNKGDGYGSKYDAMFDALTRRECVVIPIDKTALSIRAVVYLKAQRSNIRIHICKSKDKQNYILERID